MQFGVENVVATLGTAMTAENMRRLTRLTDRVMFCFDGDRAGRAAAWRAMETALPFGGGMVELKFLLLPEKDDPDTFVRSQRCRRVPGARRRAPCRCRTSSLRSWTSASTLRMRAAAHGFDAIAKPLLRRLPEGSYRETILEMLRAKMGLAAGRASDHLMADDAPRSSSRNRATGPHERACKRKTVVQKVINLALHYPRAAARTADCEQLAVVESAGRRSAAPRLRGRHRRRRRQHGPGP